MARLMKFANLIDFLCSYRASYINGIDILMDEGTQAVYVCARAAGLKEHIWIYSMYSA